MYENTERKWWKEGIVYQIYPRSFQDTTGNGIGDLQGIIKRLDYIKSLGVDIIWLNPVYTSPNDDNGYDISNYRDIMGEFGTMEDMDELMSEMKKRDLRLVMDLVVNHSSDEHQWFVESRKSRDNPYRDYYHWWPAEKGTPPKRFSYFDIDSNAWKYDAPSDSYYLHYYSAKQPDLKWENPKVREEVYDLMKFWFDKGIDGFRMDVISTISKDTDYPELPEKYKGDFIPYYAEGPHLHEYLQEMNEKVLSKYDVMTVGEAPGVRKEQALDFVDEDRNELNMFFHFDLMGLDREPGETFKMRKEPWKLTEFKRIFTEWDEVFVKKGWGSLYLNNHDFPRSVSRWGSDSKAHWKHSATLLQTFLLSMRGTPYFLYGEEIGMTNIKFDRITDYQDINTLTRYESIKKSGGDLEAFIKNEKDAGRDNARTPMQWNTEPHSGFTVKKPWLKVNENYKEGINVATQESDKDSVLNYFRNMVQVRKDHLGLVYGTYRLLLKDNEKVYAYAREWQGEQFLVLLNFSTEPSSVSINEFSFEKARLIISNNQAENTQIGNNFELAPYQASIYKVF
ncbi:glycoside hydrolase family 13 protein [Zobellia galactanivorans]|uniref:Oligo-1,6-glucosidase, family GH13 n=1 Tax=Zobellia galactanivorans (strain DSM 12802 / CCUG 47099 / CIP 106680 / NCIMB 13871 / Dsij) TaxID=63186 RepID=G0L9I2_ZOBGA|nr:alpha-glucosidase [Zobellia galactanivorans]CAZ94601.1 Oligo-1,6-glucosidase, family GH13 [Zobellia galactanivorans]